MQQANRPARAPRPNELRPETVPFERRAQLPIRRVRPANETCAGLWSFVDPDPSEPALLVTPRRSSAPSPAQATASQSAPEKPADDRPLATLLVLGTLAAMAAIVLSAAPSLSPSALLGMFGAKSDTLTAAHLPTELDEMKAAANTLAGEGLRR